GPQVADYVRHEEGGRKSGLLLSSSGADADCWLASGLPTANRYFFSISSRDCAARAAPIAVLTLFSSSGGGSTAFIPSESIQSSRTQPVVWYRCSSSSSSTASTASWMADLSLPVAFSAI